MHAQLRITATTSEKLDKMLVVSTKTHHLFAGHAAPLDQDKESSTSLFINQLLPITLQKSHSNVVL